MRRVARQEASSSEAEAGGSTNIEATGTDSSASVGDTSVADTTQIPTSELVTTASATDTDTDTDTASAATASGSSATAVATTAEVTTASDAPPTSQTDSQAITSSGGATDSATSFTDSQSSFTSSGSDVIQSTSDTQSASATLTESNSASSVISTDSLTSSTTTSDTSSFPSSTSSVPSSTTSSTSSTSSTTSSQSTTEASSSDSSSTSDNTSNSASTSLTTSFTEIISTIDGQVTTIYSPVATLNLESSDTLTTNHRNAIIAGGTIAGVAFILLCLATVFLCRRRQKRKQDRSHRYLPTPRSVMLAGEDDFDLAGPKPPQRGFGIFGSRRTGNAADEYRDLGSDSGRGLSSPEMHEIHNESPPRLLRPVASKTGSYFQESVWPPPEEGSLLSDPIMAASNVDLHSIVDDVMGSRGDASTSSLPPPSRLRGGAAENGSIFSDAGASAEFVPRIPRHHGESPTMSSIGSVPPDSPRHLRDDSTGSEVGLLANMEGSSGRHGKRSSSGSVAGYGGGPWLPPGAAPPSAYPRTISPNSPLRLVTEPQQMFSSPLSASSRQAGAKTSEAAQERRTSLAIVNPSPDVSEQQDDDVARARRTLQEDAFSASSMIAPSVSGSTSTSTQLFRRPAGTMEGVSETPYADDSAVDVRSLSPSLAHAWLLDVDEGEREGNGTSRAQQQQQQQGGQRVREELPPRYDMIRRDTNTSEEGGRGDLSRIRTL